MLDPRRDHQHTISFPLSNGYDTWGGAKNSDFIIASKKPQKNHKNMEQVQLGRTTSKINDDDDDDESGICSPPLWTTTASGKNHYRCLSPASKTQAIARGQRELMEMVKNMPESSYELSLKDLVEHPRIEAGTEKEAEEKKKLGNKNVGYRKKGDKNFHVKKRSGNIDSGGFYLKIVFPISLGSKKKTKNDTFVSTNGSTKVSPRTSVSDGSKGLDKEWWKKKSFSGSGGESDSGVSSINSGSMKSSSGSSSNNSSSSSRSNSRHEVSAGSCWPFIRRPESLSPN